MVTKVQTQKILEKEYFVAFSEQVNMSIHIFIHSFIKHVLSNFFFQIGDTEDVEMMSLSYSR